jgi:CRP/FNR family transcriptional regulator
MHDRWQRINGSSARVPLPMLQQDIADYLGVTVETVCRMLRQMARQKLVAVDRNGLDILDMGRLARIAPRG